MKKEYLLKYISSCMGVFAISLLCNVVEVSAQDVKCTKAPGIGQREFEQNFSDLNTDPYFRAATIPIWNEHTLGHGFLLEENGILQLVTVEHTANLADQECTALWIPGSTLAGGLTYSQFRFVEKQSYNNLAYYDFSDDFEKSIEKSITDGIITPLEKSEKPLQVGDIVAVLDATTGGFITLEVIEIGTVLGSDDIALKSITEEGICTGQSGEPILVTTLEHEPTSEVIAVISSINKEETYRSNGRSCSLEAYGVLLSDNQ